MTVGTNIQSVIYTVSWALSLYFCFPCVCSFQIPLGFAVALSIRVGHALGSNKARAAQHAFFVNMANYGELVGNFYPGKVCPKFNANFFLSLQL